MLRNRRIVIFLSFLFGVFLVYQLSVWSSHQSKAKLRIIVVPSDSSVTINNKESGAGVYYLAAGTYSLRASRQHFSDATQTITLNDKDNRVVYLLPEPSSKEAQNYLNDNPGEASDRERFSGEAFQQISATLDEKYPYINQLPIETRDFGIYQAAAKRTKVNKGEAAMALLVSANNPIDRTRAVHRIRTVLGIDPSTIEIIFEPSANPFQEGGE